MEDIIEKIACQFTARHIRGRPRPPYWYLGFPLYVCDSRYNDRDRVFVKIKNWNSCIPEEVRKSTEFMQIYPFERTVYPKRYPSPFLLVKGSRVKGPGGIVEEGISAKKVSGGNDSGPSRGQYVGPTTMKTTTTTTTQNAPPASTAPVAQQQQQSQQLLLVHQSIRPPGPDRSVITAAGGLAQGNNIQVEKLPPETSKNFFVFEFKHSLICFFFSAKCFDRDPYTNEMLWFSGPPINIVRTPTAQHSPTYLYYLAMKRKRKQENGNGDGDGNGNEEEEQKQEKGEIDSMDGVASTTTTQGDEHRLDEDGVVTSSTKRLKVQQEQVWPTVREMRSKLWVEMGMDKFS